MCKIYFLVVMIFIATGVKAQQGEYVPVRDLEKFKEQFTAVAAKVQTIKSDFTQEKNLSMLSEKIVSKGKFWFRKENLLRMEYTKPYEYLMILNKDNIYIKDGEKESRVSVKSNKIFQQINKIVIDCVQGQVFNNPDFNTTAFESKTAYKVELSPIGKTLKQFFTNIDVFIDKKDYSVTTIEMNENSGDNTILHFTDREYNTVIPDAVFAIK
jgi:outer membrane lipoprotein-sorting protein